MAMETICMKMSTCEVGILPKGSLICLETPVPVDGFACCVLQTWHTLLPRGPAGCQDTWQFPCVQAVTRTGWSTSSWSPRVTSSSPLWTRSTGFMQSPRNMVKNSLSLMKHGGWSQRMNQTLTFPPTFLRFLLIWTSSKTPLRTSCTHQEWRANLRELSTITKQSIIRLRMWFMPGTCPPRIQFSIVSHLTRFMDPSIVSKLRCPQGRELLLFLTLTLQK